MQFEFFTTYSATLLLFYFNHSHSFQGTKYLVFSIPVTLLLPKLLKWPLNEFLGDFVSGLLLPLIKGIYVDFSYEAIFTKLEIFVTR